MRNSHTITILAVEDDPGDFGLIQAYVRLTGLAAYGSSEHLIWAKTLREGVAAAKSNKPDVVLLDLSLPDSEGLSTVQAMRSALPGTAIVVLTGQNDAALADAALQAGAQDYLVKGQFDHDALNRAVRHAVVRNTMELQLSENMQRLELALAGGNLGTWDWRIPEGSVVYCKRWCKMLGYESGELEPSINCWIALVHPEDWTAVSNVLEQHMKGETPAYESEYRMRHKDGHWVWVLDRGKVVERSEDGKPLRAAGTCLDITKQKEAEKILLESRNHLKEQAEKMMLQLKELKGELEDVNTALKVLLKNREKDRSATQDVLIHKISHEVAPFLAKLKKSLRDRRQMRLLEVLESNLQHLASAYGSAGFNAQLSWQLTPVETQVASMIKQGMSTKDIAMALSLSAETINVHRKHIRKKLGLSSKTANLRSHLVSLSG